MSSLFFSYDELEKLELVSIEIVNDDNWDVEFMCGDMFNPDYINEFTYDELLKQKNEYVEKLKNDGVFGVVLKVSNGSKMVVLDSLWGIDNYKYADTTIRDEMKATALKYWNERQICECCKQPIKLLSPNSV